MDDILQLLPVFKRGRRLPFVQFLQLLGKLTASLTAIHSSLLLLRPLQMWLNSFHLNPKLHNFKVIRVSQVCICALAPWKDRAFLLGGGPLGVVPSQRHCCHGCILIRVGQSLAWWACPVAVVSLGLHASHQCAGAAGCLSGPPTFSTTPAQEASADPVRQQGRGHAGVT